MPAPQIAPDTFEFMVQNLFSQKIRLAVEQIRHIGNLYQDSITVRILKIHISSARKKH